MKRYIQPYFLLFAAGLLFLSSCVNHPDVPSSGKEVKSLPAIYPDYCNVTVPCNIAPLNFMLPADEYEACVARITTPDGQQQTYGSGVKVQIPEEEKIRRKDKCRYDRARRHNGSRDIQAYTDREGDLKRRTV